MAAAIKLVDTVQGDVASLPEIVDYYCSNQFQVGVLFDRWAEVLRLPEPPAAMPLSRTFHHFARSLALAGTGQPVQAQAERASFVAAAAAMGPKVSYGYNPAADVMAVALRYLDGRFALMAGDFKTAEANFRQAANAEEKLAYDEPPDWYLASNWMLGTALLKLGDAAGAEAAFRSDLKHNIGHGRSLAGLAAALRKQGKTAEADATQKRFEYAWRGADTSPAGL
jgi:tetratricopeptide (TPR) repeat protein